MSVYDVNSGAWRNTGLGQDAEYTPFDPNAPGAFDPPADSGGSFVSQAFEAVPSAVEHTQPPTAAPTAPTPQQPQGESIASQITKGLAAVANVGVSLLQQQAAAKLAQQKLDSQIAAQQTLLAQRAAITKVTPTATTIASPTVNKASTILLFGGLAAAGVALFLYMRKK